MQQNCDSVSSFSLFFFKNKIKLDRIIMPTRKNPIPVILNMMEYILACPYVTNVSAKRETSLTHKREIQAIFHQQKYSSSTNWSEHRVIKKTKKYHSCRNVECRNVFYLILLINLLYTLIN